MIIRMKLNRDKEYELLGRMNVYFENLIFGFKNQLLYYFFFLGLSEKANGQDSMSILLSKMDASQIVLKFYAIHVELFGLNNIWTKKFELLTNSTIQLIELRNQIQHASWHIGYSEYSGSEEKISRGFNDRYGKKGLMRHKIYLINEDFEKINKDILFLVKFISNIAICDGEIIVHESVKIKELDFKKINNNFKIFHEKNKQNLKLK
jgi:hypothetical protein